MSLNEEYQGLIWRYKMRMEWEKVSNLDAIYIWLGWLVGTSVKSRISEELHRGGTGRRGTGDKGGIWISWINVDCSYHPVNQNILSFRISFKKSCQTNELTKRNGINPSA